MTKRLEDEFNLPSLEEALAQQCDDETAHTESQQALTEVDEIQHALSVSEKIDAALSHVAGMEGHDSEMDDIAAKAIDSYEDLMRLGMNMSDMAAGPVFSNAASMLKIALDARDSKVTRKLKQVDLMLKKARLDQQLKKNTDEVEDVQSTVFDRNELLRMINSNPRDT